MGSLKRIKMVKNIPKHRKFKVELECGHKFIFDHSVTKLNDVPIRLPCKICFGSHK